MVMWLLTSRITWHVSSGHYFFTHIDNMYTVSPPPKKEQYFVHNFDKFKCVVMISGTQHRKSNAKLPIQLWSTSPNQCCYFALQNEMLCVLACCTTMSEWTKRKKTAVVFKFAGFKSSWWISVGNIKYNVPDVCCLSGCLKHRLKWNSIPSWIMLPSLQQPHCIDLIVSCRCISRPVLDILNTASGSNIVHHWPHDQLRSVIYLFLALDTYWCGIQWHTFLFPRQSSTILLGEEQCSLAKITTMHLSLSKVCTEYCWSLSWKGHSLLQNEGFAKQVLRRDFSPRTPSPNLRTFFVDIADYMRSPSRNKTKKTVWSNQQLPIM